MWCLSLTSTAIRQWKIPCASLKSISEGINVITYSIYQLGQWLKPISVHMWLQVVPQPKVTNCRIGRAWRPIVQKKVTQITVLSKSWHQVCRDKICGGAPFCMNVIKWSARFSCKWGMILFFKHAAYCSPTTERFEICTRWFLQRKKWSIEKEAVNPKPHRHL